MTQPSDPVPRLRPGRDPRRSIPSSELPKALHPGRQWHITERFPARYALYEDYRMPEGYWTVRNLFSLHYRETYKTWKMTTDKTMMQIQSIDPPFQLAEALYDAAK